MTKSLNHNKNASDAQARLGLTLSFLLLLTLLCCRCSSKQNIKAGLLMVIDSVRLIDQSNQSELSPFVEFKIKIINQTDQEVMLFTGQDYNLPFGDTTSFFTINTGTEQDVRLRKKHLFSNPLDTAFNHVYITKKTPADIIISKGGNAYLKLIKFCQPPATKKDSIELMRYLMQCKIVYFNKGNVGNLQSRYPDHFIVKYAITRVR